MKNTSFKREYPKIQSLYKRDREKGPNHNGFLIGEWSCPEFEYLSNLDWCWREKLDGTNIRISFNGDFPSINGRTDRAQLPAHLFEVLQRQFTALVNDWRHQFGENSLEACLYGEGVGPKIQKGGGNYGDEPFFVLFDIRVGNWWLKREDVVSIGNSLGVEVVPYIGYGDLYELQDYVRKGFRSVYGNNPLAEGVVATPALDLYKRDGERIIVKAKHKDFFESKDVK